MAMAAATAAAEGGAYSTRRGCNKHPTFHHICFYSHPSASLSFCGITAQSAAPPKLLCASSFCTVAASTRDALQKDCKVDHQHPQSSSPPSLVGSSSAARITPDEAARTELWEKFFLDPSQWWDNRRNKRSSKYPDFIHKDGKKALWINSRLSPPWIHARLSSLMEAQGKGQLQCLRTGISDRVAKVEKLWCEYFSNPSLWWDNRFIKKSPLFPDLRHKVTHEGLWIDDWSNPPWAKARMAAMAAEDGAKLKSRVIGSFGDGDRVDKLCQEGRLNEALDLLKHMVQHSIQVPNNSYISLLKECSRKRSLLEGKQVHSLIVQSGLNSNILLGGNLIDMYARCGSLSDARELFNTLPEHNVVSWTSMISAYVDRGQHDEAFALFHQMQQTGMEPDKVTFIVVLKACAKVAALNLGKQLHTNIIKKGFDSSVMIRNSLVDMYGKCGCIEEARKVFDRTNDRDNVSWNTMMAGYGQQGLSHEALALYDQMKHEGAQPDNVTYLTLVKACAKTSAREEGKQLHHHLIRSGFKTDFMMNSALVDMYAKCGCIEDARNVFEKVKERDVVIWNAMITGYVQHGLGKEALLLYEQMIQEAVQPNRVTYIMLLKACAGISALKKGRQIHSDIIKCGFDSDLAVRNTLIDMYAKCGCINQAKEVFIKMKEQDVVSWNSMIAGYAQQGLAEDALTLYEQMKQEGVQPDTVTYAIVLKACACIRALKEGKQIHSDIMRKGMVLDMIIGSALIDMYAKCGLIEDARLAFDKMDLRNVTLCNAMLAAYAAQGLERETFSLYDQLKQKGMHADNFTFVILLAACAGVGALEWGKDLHSQIIRSGFQSDIVVASALIDMYAKCGDIDHACRVFNNMSGQDVVSWSSMIAGFAQQGLAGEALALFHQMELEGIKRDEATYVSVLSACSRCGLVDEGRRLFASMCDDPNIRVNADHYACIVDLFGRAGSLKDAKEIIDEMPIMPDAVVWMTLLGAATAHSNEEIGKYAFDHLVTLEPQNDAAYVLLSSIYAAVGRTDEVARIRKEMKDAGLKTPQDSGG